MLRVCASVRACVRVCMCRDHILDLWHVCVCVCVCVCMCMCMCVCVCVCIDNLYIISGVYAVPPPSIVCKKYC